MVTSRRALQLHLSVTQIFREKIAMKNSRRKKKWRRSQKNFYMGVSTEIVGKYHI